MGDFKNGMDHWHDVQSTAWGGCKGWEAEAIAKATAHRKRAPRPELPPRQPTSFDAMNWKPATYRRAEFRWSMHCNPEMTEEDQAKLTAWLLKNHPDR
jgi:hypothetical protein